MKSAKLPRRVSVAPGGQRPRDRCRALHELPRRESARNAWLQSRGLGGRHRAWPIPSGGGVVRNMMATHDHRLVLAESGAGKLALVDIR